MKRIAIFASGEGTNAQKIMDHFGREVVLLVCNRTDAPVVSRAQKAGVPVLLADKSTLYDGHTVANRLKALNTDLVVCAGFLWKIPDDVLKAFKDRIINIHPALLPKFGGKGMYGMNVHRAVIAAGEKESGITIHQVNEHYDEGRILFQASCPVTLTDTPETLAEKIHALEHRHFVPEIQKILQQIPTHV